MNKNFKNEKENHKKTLKHNTTHTRLYSKKKKVLVSVRVEIRRQSEPDRYGIMSITPAARSLRQRVTINSRPP